MPKNKHRKPPPNNVEERRARGERVVHREDMKASLGEVLEHEHVDSAIDLLYKQDELGGNPPQSAQSDTHAKRAARDMHENGEERPMSARERRHAAGDTWNIRETTNVDDASAEEDAARVKRSMFRFVSPVFMVPAAWHATSDLIEGFKRALGDLRDAAKKARRSFA